MWQPKVAWLDHRPTQSALCGANTTTPLPAVAAPANLVPPLTVDAIDGQLKVCVVGSHNPTQSACGGANTARAVATR